MSRESRLRSAYKALSWRLLATAATFSLVLIMTGKPLLAVSVGGLEAVAKLALYFLHERLWAHIPLGQKAGTSGEEPTPEPMARSGELNPLTGD